MAAGGDEHRRGGALGAAPAFAAIKITHVYFDPPGTDNRANSHLNQEYVVIKNTGSRAKRMGGWVLNDAASHRFPFPTFRLRPGRVVRVRTGRGRQHRDRSLLGVRELHLEQRRRCGDAKEPPGKSRLPLSLYLSGFKPQALLTRI